MNELPPPPEGFETPSRALSTDTPPYPGADHVMAMPRAADSVFVCWGVTADGIARARASLADDRAARLVLRLYVIDGENHAFEERPLDAWFGRYVGPVSPAGARVVASVGVACGDQFAHVARAAAVRLPATRPGTDPARFDDAAAPPTVSAEPLPSPAFDPVRLLS